MCVSIFGAKRDSVPDRVRAEAPLAPPPLRPLFPENLLSRNSCGTHTQKLTSLSRPPKSADAQADHTTGLSKSFSAGTIYTSQGTANLITELIGVNAERVVALPMNKPVVVAGFELTLIDANHCPAAVM